MAYQVRVVQQGVVQQVGSSSRSTATDQQVPVFNPSQPDVHMVNATRAFVRRAQQNGHWQSSPSPPPPPPPPPPQSSNPSFPSNGCCQENPLERNNRIIKTSCYTNTALDNTQQQSYYTPAPLARPAPLTRPIPKIVIHEQEHNNDVTYNTNKPPSSPLGATTGAPPSSSSLPSNSPSFETFAPSSDKSNAVGSITLPNSTGKVTGTTSTVNMGNLGHSFAVELKRISDHFENLLQVQADEIRARESMAQAEINRLRLALQALSKSHPSEVVQVVEATDVEIEEIVRSAQDQVEALKRRVEAEKKVRLETEAAVASMIGPIEEENAKTQHLLGHKDQQLAQAKLVAETRQSQYQSLLRDLAEKESVISELVSRHPDEAKVLEKHACKTADQLDYLESEVCAMRQVIDELAFEREELQRILDVKDRQLEQTRKEMARFIGSPSSELTRAAAEASSERIRQMEERVAQLRQQLQEATTAHDDVHRQLEEKRKESLALVETLAARDAQIAKLDSSMHIKEKLSRQNAEKLQTSLDRERRRAEKTEIELRIAMDQQSRLKDELAKRDAELLSAEGRLFREAKLTEAAEAKLAVLTEELEEAQEHIQKLIKQTIAKDHYLVEMERRLRSNEVKRQANYLTEMARTKQHQFITKQPRRRRHNETDDDEDILIMSDGGTPSDIKKMRPETAKDLRRH